jgi:hypothetical protein
MASYRLEVLYAADEARPVQVSCNDVTINPTALSARTGGWYEVNQQWGEIGVVELRSGMNLLKISSDKVFPHIRKLRLTLI